MAGHAGNVTPMNVRRGWGLSSRIVALSLGLLLAVQAAVFAVVQANIERSAHQQIAQELRVDENVWRRLIDQNAQKLNQAAAVLAADFGFRSAVTSGDIATIRSVLDNHGARIGASVTALIDSQLRLTTVGEGQNPQVLQPLVAHIAAPLSRAPTGGQIALLNNVPYQFVLVPVRAPVLVGWVLMGFPVGQALLDDMRAISGVHVALLGANPAVAGHSAPQVFASTLPGPSLGPLLQRETTPMRGQQDLLQLLVAGESYVGHHVQITTLNAVADQIQLETLLLRSFDEVVAPFRQTQVALAWITALGVGLFGLGSLLLARRVTTPLRSLVAASEKLGQGYYDTPLPVQSSRDEIGDLAIAFDKMRVNIGTQQSEIRQLAFWDRLTGLPNRVRFRDAVQKAIAERQLSGGTALASANSEHDTLAVVTLDLDRFKLVNDVLGYAFGDQVLEAVAKRLTDLDLHADDMVARLAGNEFAILLRHSSAQDADALAQRVLKSFELPLAIAEQTIDLSLSIGIASWPVDAGDADGLLSRAEVAMYAAKTRTTGVQRYMATMDSSSSLALSLLSELRHALEHQELRLFLQPKIAQLESRPKAAEALLRWQHPVRGLIPPLEFIPFAEQTGFVRQLTLWIFTEVVRVWHGLQQEGEPFQVAINLSTRDLLDPEFAQRLDAILAKHQVPASGLCLEITESAIMDDPQRALTTLNQLHARGFKLSIDDFGTGYSSLAYLKELPVDQLKIDKSFVMAMEKIAGDAMIVRSTIDLAHNLGLTVVAEGVENAIIYHSLKKLGCDEAQGYFISKPMPADQFAAWRASWNAKLTDNRREFGQSIPMPLN